MFSPIKIGDFVVKNRVALAPVGRGECDLDGKPNDQNICAYTAIAKGGVGWIAIEHTIVSYKYGRQAHRLMAICGDEQLVKWRQLAEAVHAFDVVAVVELSLGLGRWAIKRHSVEIVAPSEVAGTVRGAPRGLRRQEGLTVSKPRELTTIEIEELEDMFVAGAKRIKRAGFDGIEIHAANGYLLAQFLSPATNKRRDKYGGSFQKRLTLPLNLITKTRKAVGNNKFLLGIRISADEHFNGGYSIEDAKDMVPTLVDAGLDYVHLSSGCNSALKWLLPPKDGMLIDESAQIKKVSRVPVFCPNIHLPKSGEEAIKNGKADVVSLGRALISDPEWANKAREGRVKDIVKCTFCNTCVALLNDFRVRCPLNPKVGWERFLPEYWPPPVSIPAVRD